MSMFPWWLLTAVLFLWFWREDKTTSPDHYELLNKSDVGMWFRCLQLGVKPPGKMSYNSFKAFLIILCGHLRVLLALIFHNHWLILFTILWVDTDKGIHLDLLSYPLAQVMSNDVIHLYIIQHNINHIKLKCWGTVKFVLDQCSSFNICIPDDINPHAILV